VVTTEAGAISRAKLQSNHHHQQTDTQLFYRPDALPVAKPTVSKHWREFGIRPNLYKSFNWLQAFGLAFRLKTTSNICSKTNRKRSVYSTTTTFTFCLTSVFSQSHPSLGQVPWRSSEDWSTFRLLQEFLQGGCSSSHPTKSVKVLKERSNIYLNNDFTTCREFVGFELPSALVPRRVLKIWKPFLW